MVLQYLVMTAKKLPKPQWTLQTILPWLLVIAGAIALVASFELTIEKFNILKNPSYSPICNINPIFSCKSVSSSGQAEVFGFPNQIIGIIGYAAVVTIGAAMLAGTKFKKWFWQAFGAGMLLAAIFLHWMIFQALYRIGALCLFCMFAWASTMPLFWYVTLYNFREGNVKVPRRIKPIVDFAIKHHGDILLAWFLIILALILKRFWYYWSGLI
jgi:uncharacterized membrane protein